MVHEARTRRVGRRLVALAAVGGLVLTACGSRLDEDEIAFYAGGGGGGGGGTAVGEAGDDGGAAAAPGQQETDAPGSSGGAVAVPRQGGSGGDTGGQGSGQAAGDGATDAPPAGDGGGGGGGGDDDQQGGEPQDPPPDDQAPAEGEREDTRAAPAGGNGGATDVGVTEDSILIYNVADLSGAVPGLFRDAYEATLAYIQYFTATEGTVYGRQIRLESRDSQLSGQGNRAAYLDACEDAFAAVGSMSAFEEGAAEPIDACQIPDLRNTPTSEALQALPNSKGAMAFRPGDISLSEWEYYKEQFPDAITNAGFVWLENNTTNYQVGMYLSGTQELGYQWNKKIQVGLAETNYARIVTELKNADIQFVAFQGAYQQAARLADSMQQQSYAPQVFALQSNIYTPDLIETCGAACEDFVMVAQNGALLEEMDSNPELQLYAEWLARVNPRARPTGLGMYSWAAAKLFVESLKAIGPEVTREALLAHLNTVEEYDANGLIPAQKIASQQATGCTVMLDIDGGQFVRIAPDQGYRCRAGTG